MRLTAQADYAVVLMAAAARHLDDVRGDDVRGADARRLNARTLADETGLPLPIVQKLVSRLAGAGLVKSARGTGGGFRLARAPAAISIADVIEAIEGPFALTPCVDEGRHDCAVEASCLVRPHWNAVNSAVRGALAGVTLASLGETPRPVQAMESMPRPRVPVAAELAVNGSR